VVKILVGFEVPHVIDLNKQPDDDRKDSSAVGRQRFRLQKVIRRSKSRVIMCATTMNPRDVGFLEEFALGRRHLKK